MTASANGTPYQARHATAGTSYLLSTPEPPQPVVTVAREAPRAAKTVAKEAVRVVKTVGGVAGGLVDVIKERAARR